MASLAETSATQILPLDLDRDYAGVDLLLTLEQWPFIRADLEVSHSQPRATAMVARRDDQLLGFFATHHFGDVGYLDMMIVHPSARRTDLAMGLAHATYRTCQMKGIQAFVAYSTNDSFGLFRCFQFAAGVNFTLLRREPLVRMSNDSSLEDLTLEKADLLPLVALDARVFGVARRTWIEALMRQRTTQFVGRRRAGHLIASICLRERRENAVCLDAANALDEGYLIPLVDRAVDGLPHRRLECFARTGSRLHRHLFNRGFEVPEFFQRIGPLVEWRKGPVGDIGASALNQTLSWI